MLEREGRDNVLRVLASVLLRLGGKVYRPRLLKLERLLDHLSGETGQIPRCTFYGCILEEYGDEFILVYREYNSLGADVELVADREIVWDGRFRVTVLDPTGLEGAVLTHVREGELNSLIRRAQRENYPQLQDLRELRGVWRRIFYTLPVVRRRGEYLLDCGQVHIEML
jgi:hypothetical protein